MGQYEQDRLLAKLVVYLRHVQGSSKYHWHLQESTVHSTLVRVLVARVLVNRVWILTEFYGII